MSLRCGFKPNQEGKRGEVFVCFIAGRRILSAEHEEKEVKKKKTSLAAESDSTSRNRIHLFEN